MLSQTREPKECFVVKTREIATFYSPSVTKFGNVVLNKLINMLICRTPHEESSTCLCVTFVCERFGLFARGSNVFCERFVLHV
jgi:hypothetical protein